MIKVSVPILKSLYNKLFNCILLTGIYPIQWCHGLFSPIFKSGCVSDPNNYRGISISSCLGKFFCSIINERVQNHPLHKSQIGFTPGFRTSDHLFTPKSLMDHHVTYSSRGKIFACFVDLRKAFDSVWRNGLLNKLLKADVTGKTYNLIKSMYGNTTCSVKINSSATEAFQYNKGVRQGCVLSPLLFNLFINKLPSLLEHESVHPFILPDGSKLSSLLYADDLVILSQTATGLQNAIDLLSEFCHSWKLVVNLKKIKVVIFQKKMRQAQKYQFFIDQQSIDVVPEYTYLGMKITSNGSFRAGIDLLKEISSYALEAIQKKFKLSSLSLDIANKIFDAIILPILTYTAEVWGVFEKNEFEYWDKTPTEKAHLKFCKVFLGVNRKASNLACRAEMGRFPLKIVIDKQILNYYFRLRDMNDGPLVKQAFIMSNRLWQKGHNSLHSYDHSLPKTYKLPENITKQSAFSPNYF